MSAINIAYRELSTTSVNANARAILQLLARAQEALQNAY